MNVSVLLFDDFETLDVFGPVEIFGRLKDHYKIQFYSETGGLVKNNHGVAIQSQKISEAIGEPEIFLIPGGYGTRREVDNNTLIDQVRQLSLSSQYVLTVCTGTSILARTGLLDGRQATSNKRAFDWVVTQGDKVNWIRKARWVQDGKYYTSAGVSAGIDMTLGFLSDRHGIDFASRVAAEIEFNWNENREEDNFYQP
jgi:transcriptional regulator GlxA family with amidase domain